MSSSAGGTFESSATLSETNEPTDVDEIATSEPTVDREIATNEPTLAAAVGLESPTYMKATDQNSTNEPTVDREIVTNEPTDSLEIAMSEPTVDREIVTNEPTPAADVGLGSPTYMKAIKQDSTNEAAAVSENVTNEATLATSSDGSQVEEVDLARRQERRFATGGRGSAGAGLGREEAWQEPRPPENGSNPPARGTTARINDGVDSDVHDEIDRQQAGEWVRAALARIAPIGAEKLRQLKEESQNEANEANAGSHSRPDRHKNGKPADQLKKRAEHATPSTPWTIAARTVFEGNRVRTANAPNKPSCPSDQPALASVGSLR